jgi:glycosyltransferase involved in cell wall biosynthesis
VPEFSIVIPVFDRENLVARAIESCLAQRDADFEVVVVDDGSQDGTASVVESYSCPKLQLIRHHANRGLGAARNTGVSRACGEWVVLLDSDDELIPGALARMSQIARGAGKDVARIGFAYRRDDGGVSPFPPLRDEVLDYEGTLRWLENRRLFDFLSCTRLGTFDHVRWREWRMAGEILYRFDLAHRYPILLASEALGLVHSDADNRLTSQLRKSHNAPEAGTDLGEEMDLILERHGAALHRFAPQTLRRFLGVRASYYYRTGSLGAGVRQSLRCITATPLSIEPWLVLLGGLAGPSAFGWVRSRRSSPN